MFIIGTGRTEADDAAQVAVERQCRATAAAARAAAMETARMALAPRRPLLGVPSRAIIFLSISSWRVASMPISAVAISPLMFATALSVPLPR